MIMDNKNISTNLLDLRAIINCLDHIIDDETKRRSQLKDPYGPIGKAYYDDHSKNIFYATECKECLSFVLDVLPRLINNFEDTKILNYKQKEIKSLYLLKEYRAKFQELENTINKIVWETNLKSNFTGIDNELCLDCAKKFKQAFKAFNELNRQNNIRY